MLVSEGLNDLAEHNMPKSQVSLSKILSLFFLRDSKRKTISLVLVTGKKKNLRTFMAEKSTGMVACIFLANMFYKNYFCRKPMRGAEIQYFKLVLSTKRVRQN